MNSFNCALICRIKYMNLGRSGGQFNQVDTSWAFSVLSAVLVLWGNRISSVVQKLKFQHKQNMLFATFFENFINFLLLRNVLGNIRNIIFSSDCSYLSLDVNFLNTCFFPPSNCFFPCFLCVDFVCFENC